MSELAICSRMQLSAAGLVIIGDMGSRSVRLSGASGSRSGDPSLTIHQVHTSLACYLNKSSGDPCVRDDLMPERLLPGRQVHVIFRMARDCAADHTLRHLGNGTRLIILCLNASVRPHGD
jgi:hypothetical protein